MELAGSDFSCLVFLLKRYGSAALPVELSSSENVLVTCLKGSLNQLGK